MELIYTVLNEPPKKDYFNGESFLVSLSLKNVLAFSSTVDIFQNNRTAYNEMKSKGILETTYYVYVCDIDKPWQVNKVMESQNRIEVLDWHPSGLSLFIATSTSECFVFQMRNFLINVWEKTVHYASLTGLDILCSRWLNSGYKIKYSLEKNQDTSPSNQPTTNNPNNQMAQTSLHSHMYMDKYPVMCLKPALKSFGGCLIDGILVVTNSGMVLLTIPLSKQPQPMPTHLATSMAQKLFCKLVVTHQQFPTSQQCVTVADIIMGDGRILVAGSDALTSSILHCYSINLTCDTNNTNDIQIHCSSENSFHMDSTSNNPNFPNSDIDVPNFHPQMGSSDGDERSVDSVAFIKFLSEDSLILCCNNVYGKFSRLELWQLVALNNNNNNNNLMNYNNNNNFNSNLNNVHPFFEKSPISKNNINNNINLNNNLNNNNAVRRWARVSALQHNSLITSIATSKFPLTSSPSSSSSSSSSSSLMMMSSSTQQGSKNFDYFAHDGTSYFQYISISYQDGSTKLVKRQSFVLMATTHLDTGINDDKWTSDKKSSSQMPYLINMQQSYTGCVLLGIDQYSCIYVMKVINTRDPVTQVTPNVMTSLLECLVVSDVDWWDVLAAVKLTTIDTVLLSLNANFNKQPPYIQDMFANKISMLRILLHKLQNNNHKAGEDYCKMMMLLMATHLKTLLRTRNTNLNEMAVQDIVTQLCKNNDTLDIEILSNPKAGGPDKRFQIGPALFNSMQHLIQWVIDLTMYLICNPLLYLLYNKMTPQKLTIQQQQQLYATVIGFNLLKDTTLLLAIKETLLLVKLWNQTRPNCLPEFNIVLSSQSTNMPTASTSTNSEKLTHLFKIVSKMYVSARDKKDVDDQLVEEVLQFSVLNVDYTIPPLGKFDVDTLFGPLSISHKLDGNYSSLFSDSFPLSFNFLLPPAPKSPHENFEKSIFNTQKFLKSESGTYGSFRTPRLPWKRTRDGLRHMVIGGSNPKRQCTRCSCLNLILNPENKSRNGQSGDALGGDGGENYLNNTRQTPATLSWDLKFVNKCICGGLWRNV